MLSYCYICVLMLLHMCCHTRCTSQGRNAPLCYVSSYCYVCVFVLLHMRVLSTIRGKNRRMYSM